MIKQMEGFEAGKPSTPGPEPAAGDFCEGRVLDVLLHLAVLAVGFGMSGSDHGANTKKPKVSRSIRPIAGKPKWQRAGENGRKPQLGPPVERQNKGTIFFNCCVSVVYFK